MIKKNLIKAALINVIFLLAMALAVPQALAKKILETFSLKTCVAAVIQAKAKIQAQLFGSASLGVNTSLGAGFSACFDLWKLGKALVEEFGSSAMGNTESSTMETSSGLLVGLNNDQSACSPASINV